MKAQIGCETVRIEKWPCYPPLVEHKRRHFFCWFALYKANSPFYSAEYMCDRTDLRNTFYTIFGSLQLASRWLFSAYSNDFAALCTLYSLLFSAVITRSHAKFYFIHPLGVN